MKLAAKKKEEDLPIKKRKKERKERKRIVRQVREK